MLAWHLYNNDIPFTWDDPDVKIRAWEASSGLIYPTGELKDMNNYRVWQSWYMKGGKPPWPRDWKVLGRGAFWFLTQAPPNGGKYPILAEVGPLHLGGLSSYHFDVPRFVLQTRRTFAAGRRGGPVRASNVLRVLSHGFNHLRLRHYVWGWTARAELSLSDSIAHCDYSARPSLYLRTSRYHLAYANPMVNDPEGWIAGSAHSRQTKPKSLPVDNNLTKWVETVERTTEGLVHVKSISSAIEGWRPVGWPDDDGLPKVLVTGEISLPPMSGNGVRHCPELMQATVALIKSRLAQEVDAAEG